jgi:hypothetical protein
MAWSRALLFWDDFAGNSLASSYTLPTYTTTVANYSVQVMSSLDYVGAAHQVLDGTMLDLDVCRLLARWRDPGRRDRGLRRDHGRHDPALRLR